MCKVLDGKGRWLQLEMQSSSVVLALKIAALASCKADICGFGIIHHVVSLSVCALLPQNLDGDS